MSDFKVGDECLAISDVSIDGKTAFYKGNYINIERVVRDPNEPNAYKYGVRSALLERDVLLSGNDLVKRGDSDSHRYKGKQTLPPRESQFAKRRSEHRSAPVVEIKNEVCRVWLKETQAKLASRLSNERRVFYLTTLISLIGTGAWVYWEYAVLRSGTIEESVSAYIRLSRVAGWVQLLIPAALVLNYFFAYFRLGTFISDIWGEDVPARYEYMAFTQFGEFLGISLFLGLWILAALVVTYITAIVVCIIGLLPVVYCGLMIQHVSQDVVAHASYWDRSLQ